MRVHFKEDPGEWRKVTLLGLIGPAAIIGLLCYRGVVSIAGLVVALALIALVALCAWMRPRWFRGYYRFTIRIGFHTFQVLGRVVLAAFFFVVLTPFGWTMRFFGKDFLQLNSPRDRQTFWQSSRRDGSLDRMF
jgi:hypothetical protein